MQFQQLTDMKEHAPITRKRILDTMAQISAYYQRRRPGLALHNSVQFLRIMGFNCFTHTSVHLGREVLGSQDCLDLFDAWERDIAWIRRLRFWVRRIQAKHEISSLTDLVITTNAGKTITIPWIVDSSLLLTPADCSVLKQYQGQVIRFFQDFVRATWQNRQVWMLGPQGNWIPSEMNMVETCRRHRRSDWATLSYHPPTDHLYLWIGVGPDTGDPGCLWLFAAGRTEPPPC